MVINNLKRINSIVLPFFYKFQFKYLNKKNFETNKLSKREVIKFYDNRDYINENKLIEKAKKFYSDIYLGLINNNNFFLEDNFNPKISYILNEISFNIDKNLFSDKIKFKKIEILDNYQSYGFVKSNNKIFGLLNKQELISEISAGIIGPEISYIWDQRPIKQILILSIESNFDNSILKLERDLMFKDTNWVLSDINYF